MAKPDNYTFRSAVNELRTVGYHVEPTACGFRLRYGDDEGQYDGQCSLEHDGSISFSLTVSSSPARLFSRYSVKEMSELLRAAVIEVRDGRSQTLLKAIETCDKGYDYDELERRLSQEARPAVAVAFCLPDDYFPDDDDICVTAGKHIAEELDKHLTALGHTVPGWARGGCAEDWGVIMESCRGKLIYRYAIQFLGRGNDNHSMVVMYYIKVPLIQRLLRSETSLAPNDPVHEEMRVFASKFSNPEVLTQKELDLER